MRREAYEVSRVQIGSVGAQIASTGGSVVMRLLRRWTHLAIDRLVITSLGHGGGLHGSRCLLERRRRAARALYAWRLRRFVWLGVELCGTGRVHYLCGQLDSKRGVFNCNTALSLLLVAQPE